MPISTLATRISTVSIWATGGGGAGGGSDRPASNAATPPAATATPRTTIRAIVIRFTFHDHASGRDRPPLVISPAKRQSMVNEAYPNRVNGRLPRLRTPTHSLLAGSAHPERVGIDDERGRREGNSVGNACIHAVQSLRPFLSGEEIRQRHEPESDNQIRQRPAEQGGQDEVREQMIETKPKRRCCGELGVAATDPALGEQDEYDGKHQQRRTNMRPQSCRAHS